MLYTYFSCLLTYVILLPLRKIVSLICCHVRGFLALEFKLMDFRLNPLTGTLEEGFSPRKLSIFGALRLHLKHS